ncbi:MAG: cation-translocating P-type ATPase [Bacteroidota bacterium]
MNKEIVELRVDGMDCNNCAASIERYLSRKGLEDVFVNFQTKEVRFQRNDGVLDIAQAKAGIDKLGFTVLEETADEQQQSIWSVRTRLLICAILTAPLLISHLLMSFGIHTELMHNGWLQLALALPVYLIGGLYFGKSAWSGLRTGLLNMDVLIFIGATAAFTYSLIGLSWQDPQYYFFETAATIITLVLMGNWLEERAVQRTTTAITALADLQVPRARLVNKSGAQVEVDVAELTVGNLIQVNTGDRIPLDGLVVKGQGTTNEAMLTGESLPQDKAIGDQVYGGSLVSSGQFQVEVRRRQQDGVLAQMIELVKTAQRDKPSLQRLADRVSAVFVPVVLVISLLTFLIGWGSGYTTLTGALMNAIAVLLISCPCAMGLATPTAVMVGVGRLASQGIMIKGGQAVETLAGIQQAVFDKTGTLTTGNFRVKNIHYYEGDVFHQAYVEASTDPSACPVEKAAVSVVPDQRALIQSIIYTLEGHSSHPIATSIRAYLGDKLAKAPSSVIPPLRVSEQSGIGLTATDEQGKVLYQLGSARLLLTGHPAAEEGQVFLLDGQQNVLAAIELADDLKTGAASLVDTLNELKIESHLLSGDRTSRVAAIAETIGISTYYAEKLPREKLDIITELSQAKLTAMVGDGINDAAALARAHVGISVGKASAAAVDAAQVVLLRDHLPVLGEGIKIARLTLKTIKESLFWAFSYNVVAIPLAAFGFLNPMWAALFMAFSDVVVIGNAIRLKHRKF